jgi:hypothetical protein
MGLHYIQLSDCCWDEMMDSKITNKMVKCLVLGLDWMLDCLMEVGLGVMMVIHWDYLTSGPMVHLRG